MTSVAIYSTNYYFGAVQELPQAAARLLLTPETHPFTGGDPRLDWAWWRSSETNPTIDPFFGRGCAAWWAYHPHLALPGVDVTVAIGQNFATQVPDFAERCLDELGDDDLWVMPHPWRDDILDEAHAAEDDWRWASQRIVEQAEHYIAQGHPRHWGLFHGGMVVRRDSPAMRAFNEAWFAEHRGWSSQNQISLPPLLRTSGIRWHASDAPFDGWVRWGTLGKVAA